MKLCFFKTKIIYLNHKLHFQGKCKFEEKIKNAAVAGAEGVIVVNNQPNGVITMSIGGEFYEEKKIKFLLNF